MTTTATFHPFPADASRAPDSKVDRVNFVVWTYGDIYTKISKKFADDWGVTIDSTISSFNDHVGRSSSGWWRSAAFARSRAGPSAICAMIPMLRR